MRLDKYMSNAGVGSRKDVSKYIKTGRVTVNGEVIKQSKTDVKVSDTIYFDNEVIILETEIYLMLNKPKGVITSTDDRCKTVMDIIEHPQKRELFPVGRLDKDTTGLMIITNDGKRAHEWLSPKKDVGKTYIVTARDVITDENIEHLQSGVPLKDFTTKPAKVKRVNECVIELTIYEGKYHQVKRMIGFLNNEVLELHRKTFAHLTLDESLKSGEYRPLTNQELNILKSV